MTDRKIPTLSAMEKALYLVERGYLPADTNVEDLANEIERKEAESTGEKPKITNDISTVYVDKT